MRLIELHLSDETRITIPTAHISHVTHVPSRSVTQIAMKHGNDIAVRGSMAYRTYLDAQEWLKSVVDQDQGEGMPGDEYKLDIEPVSVKDVDEEIDKLLELRAQLEKKQ